MPSLPPPACHDLATLKRLSARGVNLPVPEHVAIGREVPLEQIAAGAALHPFCRINGADTHIGPRAQIGAAGAATLIDSQVGSGAIIGNLGPVTLKRVAAGPGTVLGCGVAEDAVFLGKEVDDPAFTTGYGFRVRKGSLYEEDANSAQHTDTKMTILLPWATLGSNLNWCDVLVAGGVGPGLGQFSEVGSGAVHFNFTPRGDKATASLLGNVTAGVFLDCPRLFLGGNTSLVGPCEADFGAVTGAGGRYGGRLAAGLNAPLPPPAPEARDFDLEIYGAVKRLVASQVRYIAQLSALAAWYASVRAPLAQGDPERTALYARGAKIVAQNIAERIGQLGGLAARMEVSVHRLEQHAPGDARLPQQRALLQHWPALQARLQAHGKAHTPPPAELSAALQAAQAQHGPAYTRIVRALPPAARAAGRCWLAGIAARVAADDLLALLPEVPRTS